MISIPVKVSGIASLTDARYCAGMGVQYLGLQFSEHGTASLSPMEFAAIRGWIEGIEWVGEYGGNSIDGLLHLASDYDLNFWEVKDQSLLPSLAKNQCKIALRTQEVIATPALGRLQYQVWLYPEMEGKDHEINNLEETPVLLDGIENLETLKEAVERCTRFGFHFYSGPEERPGWMDLSVLQDMLEFLDERETT